MSSPSNALHNWTLLATDEINSAEPYRPERKGAVLMQQLATGKGRPAMLRLPFEPPPSSSEG